MLNNLFLAAATLTVMLGTLYPLIRQALTGEAISVGSPYFALTFAPLMAACLLILPAGPLMAWKRGDAVGALCSGLWAAAGLLAVHRRARSAIFLLQPGKLFVGRRPCPRHMADRRQPQRTGDAGERQARRRSARPCGAWAVCRADNGA